MRKLLPVSVVLFTILFLSGAFTSISDNYFEIGSKKWELSSAVIANESYGTKSKFELDLISEATDISEAKTFIWLSLTSSNTVKIADGSYHFSESSLNDRSPFYFNGSVTINEQEIEIVNGSFSIESANEAIKVHLILKLTNGDVLTGTYTGKFSSIDRSRNYN